jgi:CheY-like chemotaxis protein
MLDICTVVSTLGGAVDSKQPLPRAEAVLLVDDDDLFVRAITRKLRALGYPYVFRACSAADALDMLQRVRPTVVLTDMVMEHREAGRWVISAAERLGVAVAVVSGMPGLDETTLGHPFCSKSELDSDRLEHLVDELIAKSYAKRRESAFLTVGEKRKTAQPAALGARKTA